VKVNGNGNLIAQCFHQFECRIRLAEAGHVFDGEKMCAEFLELLGHGDIIFQRIFWPAFVEDVAVPPEVLHDFLVRAQNVFQKHRVTASLYAHAAAGQVHLRPFLTPPTPETRHMA
jgi:hypothetical protein